MIGKVGALVDRVRMLQRPGPKCLRLHLGVHKTATTHAQAALAALATDCSRRGISVLTPETIRDSGLMEAFLQDVLEPGVSDVRRRIALVDALRDQGATGATLIVSEENIFGNADELLANPIFPHMKNRTRNLRALAARTETEVFLSLRSWDEILPSAYATALRFKSVPDGFEAVRSAALASPPCWIAFLDRVMSCFPKARLRLWRQEDYRTGALTLLNAMVGGWLTGLPEIADPLSTKTPSATAVAHAERVSPRLTSADRRAAVEAIYHDDLLSGAAKFMPFSEDERAQLRDAYQAQVEQLRARHPHAFLL